MVPYHLFSRQLKSAAPHLDKVPPVFNNCTETISFAEVEEARNLYWKGIQGEQKLPKNTLEELFRKSAEINPYVGEPHAMLSQVLFNRGAYAEAAHHAIIA